LIDVIIKAQVRDTNPNNKNKGSDLPPPQKRKKGKVMNKSVSAVMAPESVSKINKQFIKDFTKQATPKQKRWIKYHLTTEIEERGKKDGFLSFRSKFAKKFFPEILAENKPKKEQTSFLDEILDICG
jgi:hypothetical protein